MKLCGFWWNHCLFLCVAELPHSPTKPGASLDQIPEGDHSLLSMDQSMPSLTTDDQNDQPLMDQSQPLVTTGGDTIAPPDDHEGTATMQQFSTSSALALQGMCNTA